MGGIKETLETIEDQYLKLKIVLENDKDVAVPHCDSNDAHILFGVIVSNLQFLSRFSNVDEDCRSSVHAIMVHILTEEAKFLARCGNVSKGASILFDAVNDAKIASVEFPLISLRAVNVCSALLIHNDCSDSIERAAILLNKAIQECALLEPPMRKLSGEQVVRAAAGRRLVGDDAEQEQQFREAATSALLLLGLAYGRLARPLLHERCLRRALHQQLAWPRTNLDRRRWAAVAITLASALVNRRKFRKARRYLCAAGFMLQQEVNRKDEVLPAVCWFTSLETLLRELFGVIVRYALGVFAASCPAWDGMSDRSAACGSPSPRTVDDSSVTEDGTSDTLEASKHTNSQDDIDHKNEHIPTSTAFTETLGRLIHGTERIIYEKRRDAATKSALPMSINTKEIIPAEYLIDVLKDTVDIDQFALCEETPPTVVQPQSFEKLDNASYIPATEEPVDIDDFTFTLKNDQVTQSSPSLGFGDLVLQAGDLQTKLGPSEGACNEEIKDTPVAVPLEITSEEALSMTPDSLTVNVSEPEASSVQVTSELSDSIFSGDALKATEGFEERMNSLDVLGIENNSNITSHKEISIKELTSTTLNVTQMSGAGDSEYSVEVWTATVAASSSGGNGLSEGESEETVAVDEVAQDTRCSIKELVNTVLNGCVEVCLETDVVAAKGKDGDEPIDSNVNVAVTENSESKLQEAIDCRSVSGDAPEKVDDSQQTDDDDQWEDVSTEGYDYDDSSSRGADSDDGLGELDLEEWGSSIPPPPVRTAKDAIRMLQSACCWLERCRVALEGRRTDQVLLDGGELLRQAARFQPEARLRRRMLQSAVRTLQAARARCDGSGDATEQRVLCALSQALLQLRLSGGGPSQLWAAAEALDRLSVVLQAGSQPTQLLVPLHVVDDVLSAPFGS